MSAFLSLLIYQLNWAQTCPMWMRTALTRSPPTTPQSMEDRKCLCVGGCGWMGGGGGSGGHCKRCYFTFEWKINLPGDLLYYAYVSIIRVFSGLFIHVNFTFLSCNYQRNAFVPTGWKIGTRCLLAVFKEKRKLEILFQLFYISQKASIWDRLSREHDVEDQIWRSEHQRTRTAGCKARGNAGNF